MWYCLVLIKVFCFYASPIHVIYMGERFRVFELLIARLFTDFFFSLSFRDIKGEKFFVSFLVIDVFDKGTNIFLID
jgi:hypothetical protein